VVEREYNCQKCKRYQGCAGKDTYTYSEIRWCPWQVLWILGREENLRNADWGNRDDVKTFSHSQHDAPFTKGVDVVAELEARLERTGVYGELLKAQVEAGRTMETLSQNAKAALMYVKGWRRKQISFTRYMREIYRSITGEKHQ